MPVVFREEGWRFVIYVDDHLPPHVHVKRPDGEVKVSLPPLDEPVGVLRVRGVATHQAVRAVRLVENHRHFLTTAWKEIHGSAPSFR